ncbi:hypothetical protein ANN_18889 [Periplaneta americana]|uniref:Cation/H+ exchanger transmembrane domain-containing protein n=1 Tax=Periplaneta americana TaxID=6978 RepID=A0ABQ8SPZ2_PERAM|nr:hypothetical protein ANN_18889 [Periplaneta americana]
MAGLCEGGNEPSDFLKAICKLAIENPVPMENKNTSHPAPTEYDVLNVATLNSTNSLEYENTSRTEDSVESTEKPPSRLKRWICCCCGERCERFWHAVTSHPLCPSKQAVTRLLTLMVLGLTLWGSIYSTVGTMAGPQGQMFKIGFLGVASHFAGWLISFVGLPPLLGMLLMGILLRNVEFIILSGHFMEVAADLRQMSLAIILIRAGLGLDPVALRRLGGMVTRLAVAPSLAEVIFIAIMTHFLLGLPWVWGFLLGEEQRLRVFVNKVFRKNFGDKRDEVTGEWRKLHNAELHALYSSPDIIRNIKSRRLRWTGHVAHMGESRNAYRVSVLAAVSPAVVIPCLFSLEDRGYGKSKGIPTLVIAAASFDDIIAISAFGIVISLIFTAHSTLAMLILRGPLGILFGMVGGIGIGIFLRYVPNKDDPRVTMFRTILLAFLGAFFMFGSEAVDYEGAGPLGAIVTAFVASNGWKTKTFDGKAAVADNFLVLWSVFQPVLFGLIGTEINLFILDPVTVGIGIASLFVALAARIVTSVLVAAGGNLTWKEKLFVAFAWFPKATVQAAIGPIALDNAREIGNEEYISYASKVLIVAVLGILITAPAGASLITFLGPRLLRKETTAKNPTDENVERAEEAPENETIH